MTLTSVLCKTAACRHNVAAIENDAKKGWPVALPAIQILLAVPILVILGLLLTPGMSGQVTQGLLIFGIVVAVASVGITATLLGLKARRMYLARKVLVNDTGAGSQTALQG